MAANDELLTISCDLLTGKEQEGCSELKELHEIKVLSSEDVAGALLNIVNGNVDKFEKMLEIKLRGDK